MSVIIRLQNLPWSANSLDIRHYFRGLSIPEGGVHIVGGEMGDAFIAFSTDEDARQAMMMTGGKIKEVQISLMLSSRNEMQKVIEAARQASMTNSLAQLLGAPNGPPLQLGQQQNPSQGSIPSVQLQQQHLLAKDRRESRDDKKDSSDMSTSSYDTVRRDKKEKSRSRSRDRIRKDRRDRDRDRDRRRRSRSRSRSRDRRRRRSRSRSRGRDPQGRDRDRKDVRDDTKKDKDVPGGNSLQDATNLPNLDILNPNHWRMMNPGNLAQGTPVLNSLANLDILRNFTGAKPLIQSNSLNSGPVPLMGTEVNPVDRLQNMSGKDDVGYGGRGRNGGFPNRRENRDGYNRDMDMNGGSSREGMGPDNAGRGGNFRNYEAGNQHNFPGNFTYGEGNRFEMGNSFGNTGGYQQRNGNDGRNQGRFGNFTAGEGYPPLLNANSRDQRGLMDYPMSITGDFNPRNDRFDQSRDDRVDEFGRSIQLRNRQKNTEDGFKEEEFKRNPPGNFQTFQNRFQNTQPSAGPQPLMRGRDSWPQTRQGDYPDRRVFRAGYEDSRNNFRNDFTDGRSQNRPRREDFHSRDRNRFPEKSTRDDAKYERDCCVEIRGLTPNIAYGDVRRPFNNLKVVIKEIKFVDYTKTDKKCRLKFLNYENKKKALQNPKKIIIEGKQVQLLHINDSEFEECADEGVRRNEAKFSDDEDGTVTPNDFYVQVTDLLPEHEEGDIMKLLSPAETERIIVESSQDGKTKTAFVKFSKAVDGKVALGTPIRKIGDHSVTLTGLTQKEFNDKSKKEESTEEEGKPEEDEVKNQETEKDQETECIVMKNLPMEASDRDICDFFSDVGLVPKRIHIMLDGRGQPSGEAYCEFTEPDHAQSACSKNGMPMGKNILNVQKVIRSEMNDALGMRPEMEITQDGSLRTQCVVAMENIPFRASVFDIINFFGWSYKLTEEDIVRKYNDRGQTTGDARVTFRTPEDAVKAVRFHNNRNLMGRVIRMKIL